MGMMIAQKNSFEAAPQHEVKTYTYDEMVALYWKAEADFAEAMTNGAPESKLTQIRQRANNCMNAMSYIAERDQK